MPRSFMLNRRSVLSLGGVAIIASGYAAWSYTHPQAAAGSLSLSAQDAHRGAVDGAFVLVDIRRPDEWALTGIGAGALPLDMRREDFIVALDKITGSDRSRPVALICARGVRSARMTERLRQAGFTNLIDVPEGMLGSRAGPGWLAKGLPVAAAP
ncbi:rhodanese-like domain-containing protein [bacterium]|nr:rhodanese-like domain-containing protein [bacterium]